MPVRATLDELIRVGAVERLLQEMEPAVDGISDFFEQMGPALVELLDEIKPVQKTNMSDSLTELAGRIGSREIVMIFSDFFTDIEQLEFLRAHHCSYGQGYYFSRPQSPRALAPLLARVSTRFGMPLVLVRPEEHIHALKELDALATLVLNREIGETLAYVARLNV